MKNKKKISIVGGGAAALSTASFLDGNKYEIHLFEKNKALGRKFLVAGDGGFNLTHAEPIEDLIQKFTPPKLLEKVLTSFDNTAFREWLGKIGIPTFVGSSNRIYPEKGIKPIEVLKAIEEQLKKNNVEIHFNKTWKGWTEKDELLFEDETTIKSDYTIFSLGGGSWKITGSDGEWLSTFKKKGIAISKFEPSNCAFKVDWKPTILQKFKGKPLKNISITCDGKTQKGEAVISEFGLEGNAIYGLSPQLRKQLEKGSAKIEIDFKPMFTEAVILEKLLNNKSRNITDCLKNDFNLSSLQLGLIKTYLSKKDFLDLAALAKKIKAFNLEITGIATLDEAISTVGGINLDQINENFELEKLPNTFCIGEMLNYDCPTGGYLLQGCFSMGSLLANYLNE